MNIERLKTSWTKYDAVKVINIVANNELELALNNELDVDEPVLRSFLGIKKNSEAIPNHWKEIQKYPEQVKLFALVAAIFTHYEIIEEFANKFSTGKMRGVFRGKDGVKQYTNIRSALVESGAAANSDRRKSEVPYDLTPLYDRGEVGVLFKGLLVERLERIGATKTELTKDFYKTCYKLNFHKAIGLEKEELSRWLQGESLNSNEEISKFNLGTLKKKYSRINAIKVNQWLNEWNDVDFNQPHRRQPPPYFLLFSIDARLLKKLSDVHRRKASGPRIQESAIQRGHNEKRSKEIGKYIHGGFPWSTLSKEQQHSDEYRDLKMPGILPTSVIVNIHAGGSKRGSEVIDKADLIKVIEDENGATLYIPDAVFDDPEWTPKLSPIEIIDGQHRLWAFEENKKLAGNYELPVVAYFNLDITWQAYLFFTINVKPVKINTSLSYDLYPLLRTQDWLERSKEGLTVYRETRAQEIVEALWLYEESPWKDRINMLGESDGGNISQAAFIRALTSSFLKKAGKTAYSMGGLFGDVLEKNEMVVRWNRSQQAGFIILLWDLIAQATQESKSDWALAIRAEEKSKQVSMFAQWDIAFISKNSFLSRDQGVRGILMYANDFFYSLANSEEWDLNELVWDDDTSEIGIEKESLDKAIKELRDHKLYGVMTKFANVVSLIDWRTPSSNFNGNEELKNKQMRYKGGSGYREYWKELTGVFLAKSDSQLKKFAKEVSTLKQD